LNRPLALQEAEVPRISKQSTHEEGKAVSPTHRPSLPPQNISLVIISVTIFDIKIYRKKD
jgi:hypothetical protein